MFIYIYIYAHIYVHHCSSIWNLFHLSLLIAVFTISKGEDLEIWGRTLNASPRFVWWTGLTSTQRLGRRCHRSVQTAQQLSDSRNMNRQREFQGRPVFREPIHTKRVCEPCLLFFATFWKHFGWDDLELATFLGVCMCLLSFTWTSWNNWTQFDVLGLLGGHHSQKRWSTISIISEMGELKHHNFMVVLALAMIFPISIFWSFHTYTYIDIYVNMIYDII